MGTPNSRKPLKDVRALELLSADASQEDFLLAMRMRGVLEKIAQRLKPRMKNIAAPLPVFPEEECPPRHPFNPRSRGLSLLRLTDIFTYHQLFLGEDGKFFVGEKCSRVRDPEHFHPFLGAVIDGQPAEGRLSWERAKFGEVIAALRARYRETRDRRREILEDIEEDLMLLENIEKDLEPARRKPFDPRSLPF